MTEHTREDALDLCRQIGRSAQLAEMSVTRATPDSPWFRQLCEDLEQALVLLGRSRPERWER